MTKNIGVYNKIPRRKQMQIGVVLLTVLFLTSCGGGGGGVSSGNASNTNTVSTVPQLKLLAGNIGGSGNIDGNGSISRFQNPEGITIDAKNNIFVTSCNHGIRKISSDGSVSTFVGASDQIGVTNQLMSACNAAFLPNGNMIVVTGRDATVLQITPTGVVNVLAGSSGIRGIVDAIGSEARFTITANVTTDKSGNIYVSNRRYVDQLTSPIGGDSIRKISPNGVVTTLAGSATSFGYADGAGKFALFNDPAGMSADLNGNIYVADSGNNVIRKITPEGVVSTIAGTAGKAGSSDGVGKAALFGSPSGVALDSFGNIFVSDSANVNIRKISPSGVVTTLAGFSNVCGSKDGFNTDARFCDLSNIAVDVFGDLFVTDNNTIRKVTNVGQVTTIAGMAQETGYVDAVGALARFNGAGYITTDAKGNVLLIDVGNNAIRKIMPDGWVSTLANINLDQTRLSGIALNTAGDVFVTADWRNTIFKVSPAGVVTTFSGPNFNNEFSDGSGSSALFQFPQTMVADKVGSVFVSAPNAIRKIDSFGQVNTIVGGPRNIGNNNPDLVHFVPRSMALDSVGNLFMISNSEILKITPTGIISTFAGSSQGYADGMRASAKFNFPIGLAIDPNDTLFVADTGNNAIRKITSVGLVSTYVGSPTQSGILLGKLPASITSPIGVAVTKSGLVISTGNAVLVVE